MDFIYDIKLKMTSKLHIVNYLTFDLNIVSIANHIFM